MTDVKICGLTRAEDVASACELGARYVGFNFSSASPRRVPLTAARQLAAAAAPGVSRVGVFVDETAEEIRGAVEAATLDLIQIHRALREEDLDLPRPVIAWLGVDAAGSLVGTSTALLGRCRAALVDAAVPGLAGGTGRTFDWSVLAGRRFPVPILLAGGLTPENAEEAIVRVRPAAVDVASGVESAPGVKDRGRLERFFAAVRRADGLHAATA